MKKFLYFAILVCLTLGYSSLQAAAEGLSGVTIGDNAVQRDDRLTLGEIDGDMTRRSFVDTRDEGQTTTREGDSRLAYRPSPGGSRTITCESQRGRYAYCRTNTLGRVRLERRLSDAPCRQYDTWGADGDGSGIWVSDGCRGVFVVESYRPPYPGRPGGGEEEEPSPVNLRALSTSIARSVGDLVVSEWGVN